MNDILLIGFMGAGKSTVGPKLAARLGLPFVDLDAEIVAEQGRPIADLFAEAGEARFRELELCALSARELLPAAVVACGGGIVTRPEGRELLKRLGTVVYLRTTVAETLSRIRDKGSRPLLAGPNAVEDATALLDSRSELYAEVADIQIDTVGLTPSRVAERLAVLLKSKEAIR